MRVLFKSYVCLTVLLGLTSALAQSPAQTVAVLDFSVPTVESNRWSWAEGGMADLLQIELEQFGLVTLDRDFIHAVLAEQRLAADGRTAPDQLELAALLNARHLITGRILPLDNGRLRVEVSAFSVETIETVVTAAHEGAFPKELAGTVRALARALADKLKAPRATAADVRPPASAFKPEALIMFYRGLNACAQGRPESAVAWFMNSSALDPDFTPPLLWEVKAYEMAGFEQHARLRREETAPMLSRLGFKSVAPGTGPKEANQPVLAVLQVAVSGDDPAVAPKLLATAATAFKQSILATGKVRLFAFESIGDSLAEQDLHLSALFAGEGAPRYGRWLTSDGLLLCRIRAQDHDAITVNLSVIDPLTARAVLNVQQAGRRSQLESLVSSVARQLIGDWMERKSAGAARPVLPLAETALTEAETREMRPAYQALAAALNQVRRAPASGDAHEALANAFVGTGRLRQAGEEINRRLDTLDIHAPKADLTYFAVHRWVSFNVGVARPWVDAHKVSRLIDELLAAFPKSVAAGCMHYNLALDAWRSGNWEEASEQAARARQVLAALAQPYETDRTMIAAAFFLEGANLFKLGKLDEAEAVLTSGQSFMQQFKVQPFALPLTPGLMEWNGPARVAGYGGDRPDLATRIQEQLTLIAQARAGQAPPDYQREAHARLLGENGPIPGRRQDWLGCAQQLAAILERVPAKDEAQLQGVLSSVMEGIRMASFCAGTGTNHDAALRPLAQRVVSILLEKRGVPSLARADSVPQAKLLDLAGEVSRVGSTAGLMNEAADTLGPLFDAPYPPVFGLSVLLRIDGSADRLLQTINHLTARLPGGEADVPAENWIHLAQRFSRESRCREALGCYRKAVAKGTPPANCPGLSATLVEATLASLPARPTEQARLLCVEAGLPPFEPVWFDWFNAGHRYQKARNYDKAIACYLTVIDFLEHPEQTGIYHLEKQPGSDRIALRWGKSLGEVDLTWSDRYNSRWYSAAFYLAQCLIEAGPREEAARWLRRIAVTLGGDKVDLLEEVTWFSARYNTEPLGVRAAEMLKQLHDASSTDSLGNPDTEP